MFITLDHNCILALEKNEEPNASVLKELVAICKSGGIPLAVYSYIMLENPPKGRSRSELPNFKERMESIGLGHIETRGRQTLWFIVDGIPTANPYEEIAFMQWVHQSMFPNVPYDWRDYLTAECAKRKIAYEDMLEANPDRGIPVIPFSPNEPVVAPPDRLDPATKQRLRELWDELHRKWNNRKSDALALCAHLSWGDGIFVTSDTNFQRKAQKLQERIPFLRNLTPGEALTEVRELVKNAAVSSA